MEFLIGFCCGMTGGLSAVVLGYSPKDWQTYLILIPWVVIPFLI